MFELHEAREDTEDVTEFAPTFEAAIGGFGDVGGETESEEVDEVQFALRVTEANYVAGAAAIFSRASRVCSTPRLVKSFRKELPVPRGRRPSVGRS
jgi:hypothetical protein